MALSEAQLAFRKNVIGGSTANIIVSGDSAKILALWEEYRGLREPDDLSDVLQVAIGTVTEPVNAEFFERRTGRKVTHRGAERLSLIYPWMACNLDGLCDDGKTVWEAKTVSAFYGNKPEFVKEKYYPQLTHNMLVCELDRACLSVIFGNGHKFEQYDVTLDEEYAEILIRAEERFWTCVQTGEPPVAIDPPTMPVKPIRVVSMEGSNEWGSAAAEWLETLAASKKFKKADESLKKLIDDDVIEAFGGGVTASRAKNGAITIREKTTVGRIAANKVWNEK